MKSRRQHRLGVEAFSRAHSLAGRLTRAAVESSVLAVVVASLAIVAALYVWSMATLKRDALMHASIAADNSTAAVLFQDRRAATETLGFLRVSPEFRKATIYDSNEQVFAQYIAQDADLTDKDASYEVSKPLTQGDQELGRVVLTVSLEPMYARFRMLALIICIAAVLGVCIASLGVRRVRHAVKNTEENLDRLAFYDPVTGLHNRHAAKEMLEEYARHSSGDPFTVALLDLDDFKLVNDTLGHKAGDDLLCNLGARLKALCDKQGTVFRLGGDEFVIIWESVGPRASLEALGQRIVRCLGEPLTVGDSVMFAKASVGLATFPAQGTSAQELLKAADTAMYQAKSSGKNTYAIYDLSMAQESAFRLQMSTDLALAIERDELLLHYQPIVDIASRELIGVEALVRWNHPTKGLLSAAQFIDVAEESGQVAELGGWVLKAAARQQVAWAKEGFGHLFIAVNVSAHQFKRGLLMRQLRQALDETGANPAQLQVELTEHTLLDDVDSTISCLGELRALGIKVAIDDFGTGLSSLSYLKRLPVDKLKIDRSFVDGVETTAVNTAIVNSIVTLAHALTQEVVAEGIETLSQLRCLESLGADHGQGYYFSRPMPAAAVVAPAEGSAYYVVKPAELALTA